MRLPHHPDSEIPHSSLAGDVGDSREHCDQGLEWCQLNRGVSGFSVSVFDLLRQVSRQIQIHHIAIRIITRSYMGIAQ